MIVLGNIRIVKVWSADDDYDDFEWQILFCPKTAKKCQNVKMLIFQNVLNDIQMIKLNNRVVLDGACDDDFVDLWASLSTVRGSKLQQVEEVWSVKFLNSHPIQPGF